MSQRIARTTLGAVAALLAACSVELPPDPCANCLDLGTLSLPSANRADAEVLMRTRVRGLGGDTLIFGKRGRVRRDDTPEEVSRGRKVRLGTETASVSEAPAAASPERSEAQSPVAPQTNGVTRRGKVTAQPVEPLVGELWYYGAALRCNPMGNGMLAGTDQAPMPLVRIAPDYPPEASAGAEGEVILEFTIAATGTTKDIVVVTSSRPSSKGQRYRL